MLPEAIVDPVSTLVAASLGAVTVTFSRTAATVRTTTIWFSGFSSMMTSLRANVSKPSFATVSVYRPRATFVKRAVPCSSDVAAAIGVWPGGTADNEQFAPATGKSCVSFTTTLSPPAFGVWPRAAARGKPTQTNRMKYRSMGDRGRISLIHSNQDNCETLGWSRPTVFADRWTNQTTMRNLPGFQLVSSIWVTRV